MNNLSEEIRKWSRRWESRQIFRLKLIENPHPLAVKEKKFFCLQKIKSKMKKDFVAWACWSLAPIRSMTGLNMKPFLPHRLRPVGKIKQTYKSQMKEGALRAHQNNVYFDVLVSFHLPFILRNRRLPWRGYQSQGLGSVRELDALLNRFYGGLDSSRYY